jgi:hypothetical protein
MRDCRNGYLCGFSADEPSGVPLVTLSKTLAIAISDWTEAFL